MPEFAKMTWLEIDALRKESDLALIPSGAVEVYGRHLPNGSDGIVALAIAQAVAERIPAGVTPLIPVGESKALASFPGTLWVSAESLRAYMEDMVKSVIHWGFRRLLFINSHAGNVATIGQMAKDLQESHGVICAQVDTWRFIQPFTADLWETDLPHGHASEAGTSMLLKVAPELVKMEMAAQTAPPANPFREFIQYRPYCDYTDTGTVGDGTAGSLEKGEIAFTRTIDRIVEFIHSEKFR